ncbi:MAG: hypothetical protein ACR2MK_10750, partial [Solirubrobacteraceae bacterium]
MRPVSLARGVVLLVSAYALVGCGASPRDEVQAKVEQFAHATAARDSATLCQEVLAPDLVTHLTDAGLSCQQAMRIFVDSVSKPTLTVSRITVKGASASVVVLTAASGQPTSLESIQLIDTKHGWRLDSL